MVAMLAASIWNGGCSDAWHPTGSWRQCRPEPASGLLARPGMAWFDGILLSGNLGSKRLLCQGAVLFGGGAAGV
jgi:hypothetical protein